MGHMNWLTKVNSPKKSLPQGTCGRTKVSKPPSLARSQWHRSARSGRQAVHTARPVFTTALQSRPLRPCSQMAERRGDPKFVPVVAQPIRAQLGSSPGRPVSIPDAHTAFQVWSPNILFLFMEHSRTDAESFGPVRRESANPQSDRFRKACTGLASSSSGRILPNLSISPVSGVKQPRASA